MVKLSPHFTLEEMTRSQTAARKGIPNDLNIGNPTADILLENGRVMCLGVLEPLRVAFDKPFIITSGYRSPALNDAIGGSPTSSHCQFQAADFVVMGMEVEFAFQWVKSYLLEWGLPFDQLILEYDRWIHLGVGPKQRRQVIEIE